MITTVEDKPLSELASELKVSYRTVFGWYNEGLKANSGEVVKLEAVRLPAGLGSSMNRYREFCDKLNDG